MANTRQTLALAAAVFLFSTSVASASALAGDAETPAEWRAKAPSVRTATVRAPTAVVVAMTVGTATRSARVAGALASDGATTHGTVTRHATQPARVDRRADVRGGSVASPATLQPGSDGLPVEGPITLQNVIDCEAAS